MPSIFSTPPKNPKSKGTSSSDLCSRQTLTSWTSSVQVRPISPSFGSAGCLRWLVHLGCFAITTVFSHAQTVVLCGACSSVLCQPTGGKARLTEGPSLSFSRITQDSYMYPQAAHIVGRTRLTMFWVFELPSRIVLHTHYLVFLITNANETSPVVTPSTSDDRGRQHRGHRSKVCF